MLILYLTILFDKQDFSVSPRPLGCGFLGLGAMGLGPGLDNVVDPISASLPTSFNLDLYEFLLIFLPFKV